MLKIVQRNKNFRNFVPKTSNHVSKVKGMKLNFFQPITRRSYTTFLAGRFLPITTFFGRIFPTTTIVSSKIQKKLLNRSFSEEGEEMEQQFERKPRRERQFETNVLMIRSTNLEKVNEADIKNVFEGTEIPTVRIIRDSSGKPLGPAFLEFMSNEAAGVAFKMFKQSRDPESPDNTYVLRPSTSQECESAFEEVKKPCCTVAIRRIPFSSSEEEILSLFPGSNVLNISVGNGSAFIKFATKEEADAALLKSGTTFARKNILVHPAMEIDLNFHAQRPIRIIRIRGSPSSCTEDDFRTFFTDLDIKNVTITTREGISGRQVPGDVFVEFTNHEDLLKALKFDRQTMGERYLQIFRSSARERKSRVEGPRRPFNSQPQE